MKRRDLMLLLGGAITAPRALRAQQKAVPVIGILASGSPNPSAPFGAAFPRGLSEARWVEGQYDRLPELAADHVARKVDVIAANGLPSALAAKSATATIPIVFIIG